MVEKHYPFHQEGCGVGLLGREVNRLKRLPVVLVALAKVLVATKGSNVGSLCPEVREQQSVLVIAFLESPRLVFWSDREVEPGRGTPAPNLLWASCVVETLASLHPHHGLLGK